MALGFIKKIFSFGKETAAVPTPEDKAATTETTAVEDQAIVERDDLLDEAEAANPDPVHGVIEAEPDIYPLPHAPELPVVEDPVIEAEIETAGGPSDDETSESATQDDIATPPVEDPVEAIQAEEAALAASPISEPENLETAEPEPEEVTESDEPSTGNDSDTPETASLSIVEAVEESSAVPTDNIAAAVALPKGFSTRAPRPAEPEVPAIAIKRTWFQRLREGLSRTSSQLTGQIASLFTKRKLDDATLQDLEDLLIQADLGVETALRITDTLASERYGKDVTGSDVSRIMAGEITRVLSPVAKPLELDLSHKPHVILVVGVNGTGKTTTIGKLAAKLSGAGLKVMMAAGDTFRAAAIEQLKIWAERTGSEIVSSRLGADAAGLAYEAYEQAKLKKSDVLIIDTAGRLQNKAELMAELEKIVRVLGKLDPDAPHTVLQTLDATTGQNAMNQVEIFRNVAGVSGLIMTKLDGTARGGILVAIAAKHKLPVYFIGVGEGIDDLEPFEARDFAEAIAGVQE
jgi:fused signal recognition particle receptor